VTVFAGESGPIDESFSSGNSADYTKVLSCTGNNTALSGTTPGSTLTINPADTAITCTITNTLIAASATVTINKVLNPSNDPGLFNLQIDNVTAGTGGNVGNGGTTGQQTVSAGVSHTVGETAGNGTSLGNYTSTIDCGAGPISGTSTTITPSANTTTTCTITNTRNAQPVLGPQQIPTLNPALLLALGLFLAGAGGWALRRRDTIGRSSRR
jgi:hypothetical protein